MLKHKNIGRIGAGISLSLLCLLTSSATAANTSIQSVAQSYGSTSSLQQGIIVQIAGKNSGNVQAATLKTVKQMQGVVVAANDAPVTLSSTSASSQQVYVANSGRYNVLVSSQNGSINSGDYITVSSLDGIGMKADGNESEILGRAAAGFDGKHNVISSTSLKNQQGQKQTIAIARIPVTIAIGPNPLETKNGNGVPAFLQKTVQTIVGKPVSAIKIYLGLAVVLISAIFAGSLLYGGVQSGMVSIGRNPLARKSIMRNLFQVITTSLIIFIGGLFAVYLILKL